MASIGYGCLGGHMHESCWGPLSTFGPEDLQSPCWDGVSGSFSTLSVTEIPHPQ